MMKRLKSKKGMTLVELIITMVIMTLVIGAAAAVFLLTMDNWEDGVSDTRGHQDAALAESWIHSAANQALEIRATHNPAGSRLIGNPWDRDEYLFFRNNDLELNTILLKWNYPFLSDQPKATLTGIREITFDVQPIAGSRFRLSYEIRAADGYLLSGGVVLNNVSEPPPGEDSQFYSFPVTLSPGSDTCIIFAKNRIQDIPV